MANTRSTAPTRSPALAWPSIARQGGTPFNPALAALQPVRWSAPDEHTPASGQRTRLWELAAMLHCSVIGTCLTTAELRKILGKLGVADATDSEHDLHKRGVALAGRHDGPGWLLDKALEDRHRLMVRRFAAARTEAALREKWQEALAAAEIAGGYWAALTHPASTPRLIHEAFGEVHMLSHLVGAANRADIRRLRALEQENAAMAETLARQQAQLRDGMVQRDAEIRDLRSALAARATEPNTASPPETRALQALVTALEQRVAAETQRRAALEARLDTARAAAQRQREAHALERQRADALAAELVAIEASLAMPAQKSPPDACVQTGLTLLYVGGRPQTIPRLRALAAQHGAELLHHDAGVEASAPALAGMASRADVVLFPVDCVSHAAALLVKRHCQQTGKPMVPLRSAGATSFLGWLAAGATTMEQAEPPQPGGGSNPAARR